MIWVSHYDGSRFGGDGVCEGGGARYVNGPSRFGGWDAMGATGDRRFTLFWAAIFLAPAAGANLALSSTLVTDAGTTDEHAATMY
jgi:hypothetical protein